MASSHSPRLSLVSCPILLYPATSDAHDGETGVVVDTEEIVKGHNPDRLLRFPRFPGLPKSQRSKRVPYIFSSIFGEGPGKPGRITSRSSKSIILYLMPVVRDDNSRVRIHSNPIG